MMVKMSTEHNQDMAPRQETRIDLALEDAERMLYFASKGKIHDETDLVSLKELARAMVRIRIGKDKKAIGEEDLAHFYSQLSIMAHILYPVTSESLKVMEGMSKHSCKEDHGKPSILTCAGYIKSAACSSPMLMLLMTIIFVISLIITPWLFNYSTKGSNTISRLDATIKDRVAIKKELVDEVKSYSSKSTPPPPQEEGSDKNKSGIQRIASLINRLEVKTAIFQSLLDQLDQWNKLIPGQWIVSVDQDVEPEKKKATDPQVAGASEEKKPEYPSLAYNDNVDTYLKAVHEYIFEARKDPKEMKKGLKVKNTGLLILQTINGTVLLLLFGFCGASAFIMKKTIQAIQTHTFTGIRCTTWLRILLGTFCGFFLGYLGSNNELLNLLTSDNGTPGSAPVNISQVSSLTLAFIGGYSVDLLFSILNRFIYAVTNDDRYLSASEIVRRKVDVSKFIGSKAPTTDSTVTGDDTLNGDTGSEPVKPMQDRKKDRETDEKPPA